MIVKHYQDIPAMPMAMEGALDVTVREVFTPRTGAPHFSMRIFEVAPGGHTPLHDHAYEHEIFILEGLGEITEGRRIRELQPGSTVFIQPGTPHQLRNPNETPFRFLCLIPNPEAAADGCR
jgi:quercetin dioxygenase-like cupin family protein